MAEKEKRHYSTFKGKLNSKIIFWYVEVYLLEIPKLQVLERFTNLYFEEF